AHAAGVVLLGEALGLFLDRLLRLGVDQFDHLPGDDAEHHSRADDADAENDQRQLERRGAEQLSEDRHATYIRRRARCAAAARRNRGRSWPAAATYGRR